MVNEIVEIICQHNGELERHLLLNGRQEGGGRVLIDMDGVACASLQVISYKGNGEKDANNIGLMFAMKVSHRVLATQLIMSGPVPRQTTMCRSISFKPTLFSNLNLQRLLQVYHFNIFYPEATQLKIPSGVSFQYL